MPGPSNLIVSSWLNANSTPSSAGFSIPNYPSGTAPWSGQPVAVVPPSSYFTPQTELPAPVLNWLLGGIVTDLVSLSQFDSEGTGSTTIASGSNGAVLPQATINVASTAEFSPGPSEFYVQTSDGVSEVSYTSTNGTQFLGCSGGVGTLATGGAVGGASPDGNAFGGRFTGAGGTPTTGLGAVGVIGTGGVGNFLGGAFQGTGTAAGMQAIGGPTAEYGGALVGGSAGGNGGLGQGVGSGDGFRGMGGTSGGNGLVGRGAGGGNGVVGIGAGGGNGGVFNVSGNAQALVAFADITQTSQTGILSTGAGTGAGIFGVMPFSASGAGGVFLGAGVAFPPSPSAWAACGVYGLGGPNGNGGAFEGDGSFAGVAAAGGSTPGTAGDSFSVGLFGLGGSGGSYGVYGQGTGGFGGVYGLGGTNGAGVYGFGGANGDGLFGTGQGSGVGVVGVGGGTNAAGVVGSGGGAGPGGLFASGTAGSAAIHAQNGPVLIDYDAPPVPQTNSLYANTICKAHGMISTDGLGGVSLAAGHANCSVSFSGGTIVIAFGSPIGGGNYTVTTGSGYDTTASLIVPSAVEPTTQSAGGFELDVDNTLTHVIIGIGFTVHG